MDRPPPEVAAAMHDCFEGVDTVPLDVGAGRGADRRFLDFRLVRQSSLP
jgi:hypothetical protein